MAKSDIKKSSKKSASKKQEEKATKKVASSSESESSSSESSSSSSSESESESEDEKKEEKKDSSSSESDSDSESEDEKKEEKEDSSSDSEDEKKEEKAESSSSSESSDSESEDEEKDSKKRKSEDAESTEPETKKAKTEETSDEPATLFVGRLSWNIDDNWLMREFEAYEGVLSARVINDRATGRSKGYGYVDFASKTVAEKALEEMQGKEVDGRPINVDLSTSKPKTQDRSNDRAKQYGDQKSEPSDTLFIGNLSFDSNNDNVTEFFAEYGPILGVRLPTHPETEQLKGFGYVQFGSVESAQKALEALNGEFLNNRPVRLDYSTPKPQNEGGRSFGGNRGRGGNRGGNRGGRGGFGRDRQQGGGFNRGGSGANSTPVGSFRGTKKTFD